MTVIAQDAAVAAGEAERATAPRRRPGRRFSVGTATLYVVLTVGSLLMIAPFIWMILTSLKSLQEVNGFTWLPTTWHLENYSNAFSAAPFALFFRNSIILVVGQTIPSLIISSAAGYALAQLPVRGNKALLNYFIAMLVIPFQILIVPLFLLIRDVPLAGGNNILGQGGTGWQNTWFALIVPFIANPLFVFLSRQFFVSLPGELADAARVDGLGEIGILVRIMAPLAKPAFITIALFNIESAWNGFLWPLVATSSEELRPLQFGLATFSQNAASGGVQWPFLMAMSTVATLPMILLFLFGQRFFVAGVATAGLKG